MKRRARTSCLTILLGASLVARLATAQPASPTPLEFREAQLRQDEGRALHQQKRDEEALLKFRQAYLLSGANGNIHALHALFGIARMEQLTGHLVEAMQHFKQFLDAPAAEPTGPGGKEAAQKYVDELSKQLARITIEAPPGAALVLDGKALGATEHEVYALPGEHTLEGTLDGHSDRHGTGPVAAGSSVTVKLFAVSPPPAPDQAPETPIVPSPTITTAAAPSEPDHSTRPAPLRIWLTAGLGVAAVGALVSGVYFAEQSNNDANSATAITTSSRSPCLVPTSSNCMSLGSDLNSQRTDETISLVMYTGAGVLAAGAVLSWFFLPKTAVAESSPGVSALPLVGPGLLGIQWSKRF